MMNGVSIGVQTEQSGDEEDDVIFLARNVRVWKAMRER